MSIVIHNNKPTSFSPVYFEKLRGDLDIKETVHHIISEPIFQPMIANQPVTATYNGNTITEDDIDNAVLSAIMSPNISIPDEIALKSLFNQSLVNYDKNTNLTINDTFAVQAAQTANPKLPEPNPMVVYTPASDIIPVAREFMAGQCSYEKYFASLAYTVRVNTLGFYFVNDAAFTNFKNWIQNEINQLGTILPADTLTMFGNLQSLNLTELTESMYLRSDNSPNNHEYSFPRVLMNKLMNYTNVVSSSEFGVLPFSLSELIYPTSIVFVNVEKHARSSAQAIRNEWNLIQNALANKPKVISNKKLNSMTTVARNAQHISQQVASFVQMANNGGPMATSGFVFGKKAPTAVDVHKAIKRIIEKTAYVNSSMNTFKITKMTFNKPNRRNPDDFNKQGKSTSTRYKPDLHVYLDTSGSISERDYKDAIQALIALAKQMNINMYFNSFSHYMSQTTKLNLQGKNPKQIYKEFAKIPKVSGGTDYEQIWNFINSSAKMKREVSLIISDFEYSAPSKFVKHPKNLYYIPISSADWTRITSSANSFAKSMLHNDPAIRRHILM